MPKSRHKGRRPDQLDQWKNLRQQLLPLLTELHRFPSPHDLEQRGRYDLMRAIVRHGGSAAVAGRLRGNLEAAAQSSGIAPAPVDD